MANDKPVVVDLFSGVGGFSLGFEIAGFSVEIAVDNSQEAVNTYAKNFPDTEVRNLDLSDVDTEEIVNGTPVRPSDVDVVIGGPPCQGFSLMGKRDTDDERNSLLLDFADHISELNPDYFVMENVEGLATGEARNYLDAFLESVRDAGYDTVEPLKPINAVNYGVPQNRSRLFVMGYRSGLPAPNYPSKLATQISAWDALSNLPDEPQQSEIEDGIYCGDIGTPTDYIKVINSWKPRSGDTPNGLTGLEPVDHEPQVRDRFQDVSPGNRDQVSRYHRLKKDNPSPTLRAGSARDRGTHTAARPIHPVAPRVITVREAARLQSFPDWFQFHPTKYHGMRHIGNSVPPLLAEQIGEKVLQVVENSRKTAEASKP